MDKPSVKIVKLDINENDEFSGVDAIALVESPAIEAGWMFFNKQEVFESYSDYPDAVSNNAKRGIELNDKVNNKCATQVGKVRAQQLAQKEPVSVETIKRMYSYLSRAEEYYDESDTEACGTISYLLWGGLAAKRWSEAKLKELGLFEGDLDVSGLAPYINEPSGSLIVKDVYGHEEDKEMVDGVVELISKVRDLENRKELVMDTLRDFALEGVYYDLDDFLRRVGVTMSDLNFVENAGGFSVGDYVSWTFAGRGDDADRGRGQIIDLRIQGEVNVPETDVTLTATEEEPVALIRTRSGKVVGQYTRNLRKIQKPEGFVNPRAGETEDEFISRCIPVLIGEGKDGDQAAAICYSYWKDRFYDEQTEEVQRVLYSYVSGLFDLLGFLDGLPVFATPQEAEEVAVIAGCRGYHSHPMGDFIVYMPCEEHEPEWDEILQKAYEDWKQSKMKSWKDLSENELEEVLSYLDSVAESDVLFDQETFARPLGKITGGSAERSVGRTESFLDTPTTKFRYKYSGPVDDKNRDFCRVLMTRYTNQGKVFRKEDINQMSIAGVNTGFGPGGVNQYDIFNYKGGVNCRHDWEQVKYSLNSDGRWVDSTMVVGQSAETQNTGNVDTESIIGRLLGVNAIGTGFSKQEFAEQQIVAGPLMIPNKLIYRYDEMNGEYFVYFSEDTIQKIAYKYMQNKYTDSTNLEHNGDLALSDVFVVESWIISDPERDKSTIYSNGERYPKGTWYGMVKVKNKEVWENYVKSGLVKGFSVEGFFIDELLNKTERADFQ